MMNCSSFYKFLLCFVGISAASTQANAADSVQEWEHHNNWRVVISNKQNLQTPLFVTLKQVGQHWEIDKLYNSPPKILRSQKLELFMATRDLQQWKNFYTDAVINCDSYEAREADFHSVCTSTLSEQQSISSAMLGILLGGGPDRPVLYNREKVAAVIHSIPVEQATRMLTEFENEGK